MTVVDDELVERTHRALLEVRGVGGLGPAALARLALDVARREAPLLPVGDRQELARRACARVTGLGPLDALLADPAVTEVMVNGRGPVWVERRGRLEATGLELDAVAVRHLIERIVAPLGLRADRSAPLVDARLPDGSRVNAVVPPLAVDGPCLTIRRFGVRALALADFTAAAPAALLSWAVAARANLVVSGGTGTGKTTLLNALGAHLDPGERVITIEDTAELALPGEHVVRLEARPPNADGIGGCAVRDLLRNALRMRPDRIVVGEVRGGEALDMLQAMNTGHEGSLSTCHANSPADALRRLETMALLGGIDLPLEAVRDQLAAAVDLVVQVGRTAGGGRRITAVDEVLPPGEGGGGLRTAPLVRHDEVVALPARPVRRAGHPGPSAAWLRRGPTAGPLGAG